MPNLFPWSNFHELNLDWILEKIGLIDQAEEKTKEYKEAAEGAAGAAESASGTAENAKTAAVEAKVAAETAAGNAGTISDSIRDSYAEDIADLNSRVDANSARIDTFTSLEEGSTTGDAELADGRVDFLGNTFDNIGDAIRAQGAYNNGNIMSMGHLEPYTFVSRKLNLSGSGITAQYDSGKIKLYGTSTAARSLIALNNQLGIITSGTAFTRTLPAGRYKVKIKSTGVFEEINYLRCSYSTLANAFTVNDGDVIDFTADVMVAIPIANSTFFGTEDTPTFIDVSLDKIEATKHDRLNVLFIGNSFTQDVCAYMPPILADIAPHVDLRVGVCYTASATIGQHTTWLDNDTPYTVYNQWVKTSVGWRRDSSGTINRATTLHEILDSVEWDVIVLQSVADESEPAAVPGLIERARILRSKLQPLVKSSCKFAFLAPSARAYTKEGIDYDIETVYENTISMLEAVKLTGFDFIFPVATAIQNARSNETFNAMGVDGDMSYDGKHLQAGIPDLIACYTIIKTLLDNCCIIAGGINGAHWVPTLQNSLDINATQLSGDEYLGMVHGEPEGVSNSEYIRAAQEIAIIACNNPLAVTDCSDVIVE